MICILLILSGTSSFANTNFIQNLSIRNEIIELNGRRARLIDFPTKKLISILAIPEKCIQGNTLFLEGYLVSLGITCRRIGSRFTIIEERKISPFEFDLEYLGKDERGNLNFAINERDFHKDAGRIFLKRINSKTQNVFYGSFLENVPGFSGGMARKGNELLFSIAFSYDRNEIHSVSIKDIASFSGTGFNFSQFESVPIVTFSGLSFSLWVVKEKLLIDNSNVYGEGYESYIYNFQNDLLEGINNSCKIVGVFNQKFLRNCEGKLKLEILE